MRVESGARTSNPLSGELRSRPLAVLLAGACERGTSGTFKFRDGSRCDVLTLRRGKIAVVRTSDPIAYLGSVLYELGAIDLPTLDATLHEVAGRKRLHGEVLIERSALSRDRLAEGLAEQTFRKTQHLFTLSEKATWAFREDVDELTGARDEERPPIETWKAIWRGLRDQPLGTHVRKTLAKVDGGIQLRDVTVIAQFGLTADERTVCERLFARPTTLAVLTGESPLAPERTELLVYLLALARCVVRLASAPISPSELGVSGIRERARQIDGQDPKAILGIPDGATIEAARAAYFRLARLWHPERIPEALGEVRAECEQIFFKLGEAHRILSDTHARRLAGEKINSGAEEPAGGGHNASMRDVDAALARNDLEGADALAKALSSAGSDGPAARAVIAWCGAAAGRAPSSESLERAVVALDKVLTGDPECVRALFYRAKISSRLGRSDAALRDYKKVIRLDPGHVDALREVRLHAMRGPAGVAQAASARDESARSSSSQPEQPAAMKAFYLGGAVDGVGVRSGLRRLIRRATGK